MKRIVCLFLLVALLASVSIGAVVSAADPGSQEDPVVSLSYLNSVYQPLLLNELHMSAAQELYTAYNASFLTLAEEVGAYNQQIAKLNTGVIRRNGTLYLKAGDVLTLLPGTKVTLNTGSASANSDYLVNVSAGTRLSTGEPLTAKMYYMKADSASGGLIVTSESAALTINGPFSLQVSDAVNYASRADVLKELGLFLGSSVGYELEKTASRAHGIVVFLRIMGLEDEALAFTGTHPFTDVPAGFWAEKYIAYAYHNGFTKGYTDTLFKPNTPTTAKNYIAFMMRALNYEEGVDFTYTNILADCVSLGLYTQAEVNLFTNGAFARGRMVYLSYYSLFCTDQESGNLLLTDLIASGTVTQDMADRAICKVVGTRLT